MKQKIILLFILLTSIVFNAKAYDFSRTYRYGVVIYFNRISDSQVEVTSGDKLYDYGIVNIPDTVIYAGKTYNVTSIGEYAFANSKSMGEITLPNTLTSIKKGAFHSCWGLTSIKIPNSVVEMEDEVFGDCWRLKTINLSELITSIGDYVFSGCSHLESITLPDAITHIGNGAFLGCLSLKSINLPDSIKEIWYEAFRNCKSLTSVKIPGSVTYLTWNVFTCCTSLTSVTISNSITDIGYEAFSDCISLSSIVIPKSVTGIQGCVFKNCPSLTSISLLTENPKNIKFKGSGIPEIFDISTKEGATLYVPLGSKELYVDAPLWKEFHNIAEKPEGDSGVESIGHDNRCSISVHLVNNNIEIVGTVANDRIRLYNIMGQLLYMGISADSSTSIPVPINHGEVYVIKLGEQTLKCKF